MTEKQLNIVDASLTKIAKILVNKRAYAEGSITKVGEVIILEESASFFNDSNYVEHTGMEFVDSDTLRVYIKGLYITSSSYQTFWNILDSDGKELVSLLLNGSKLCLNIGKETFTHDVTYASNDTVDIDLKLTGNSYEITITQSTKYLVYKGNLTKAYPSLKYAFSLSKCTDIRLGGPSTKGTYWYGTIDLSAFVIFKGSEVYYSSSISPKFTFSKVLVCGEGSTLTDTSVAVAGAIYEFEISDINISGNKATISFIIGSSAHLIINKIGLYITLGGINYLFALAEDLEIKKTGELDYDLRFNVSIFLGVINSDIKPEVYIEYGDNSNSTDFLDIKNAHTYAMDNIERDIERNTYAIGLNHPENNYLLFRDMNSCSDGISGVQRYLHIKTRVSTTYTDTVDKEICNVVGDLINVDYDTGEVSNFSKNNYVYSINTPTSFDSFELKTAFMCSNILSGGTIMSLPMDNNENSLELKVLNKGCYMSMNEADVLKVRNKYLNSVGTFYRKPEKDFMEYDKTTEKFVISHYAWYNSEGVKWNNPHVVMHGEMLSDGFFQNFSETDYLSIKEPLNLGSPITLEFPFIANPSATTTETLLCATVDKKLKVVRNTDGYFEVRVGNGTNWFNADDTCVGTAIVGDVYTHTFKLTYDGTNYATYIDGALDWSFKSASVIGETTLNIGLDNDSSNPWGGGVDIANSKMEYEDEEVKVYITSMDINFVTGSDVNSNQILFNADTDYLFCLKCNEDGHISIRVGDGDAWVNPTTDVGTATLTPNTAYNIKIKFDGTTYKSYLNDSETPDWTLTTDVMVVDANVIFGKEPDGSNPWKGTIDVVNSEIITAHTGTDTIIWYGVNNSEYIFTSSADPDTLEGSVDNEEFDLVLDEFVSYRKGESMENNYLFQVGQNTKYYILCTFSNNVYSIYTSLDDEEYTLVQKFISGDKIGVPNKWLIGVSTSDTGVITNPLSGTVYLLDTYFLINGTTYSFIKTTTNEKGLKSYYHVPRYEKNIYYLNDLEDITKQLYVYDGDILGEDDFYDVSLGNCTLVVKADLQDSDSDKIILAKRCTIVYEDETYEDETYFILEYVDNAIVFKLYAHDNVFTLTKQFTNATFLQATQEPILITVICTKKLDTYSFKMYINNELAEESDEKQSEMYEIEKGEFTNYLTDDTRQGENYVKAVMVFNGALDEDEIFYLTNILDTNH